MLKPHALHARDLAEVRSSGCTRKQSLSSGSSCTCMGCPVGNSELHLEIPGTTWGCCCKTSVALNLKKRFGKQKGATCMSYHFYRGMWIKLSISERNVCKTRIVPIPNHTRLKTRCLLTPWDLAWLQRWHWGKFKTAAVRVVKTCLWLNCIEHMHLHIYILLKLNQTNTMINIFVV